MQKIYRRLLLFIFTVAFLTLAPLVVLYAIGYRANLHQVDPLPVGVISVETTPRRADIKVDEVLVGKSPRTVTNIEPGARAVEIELEGYQTWRKQIEVQPGRASEIKDILLIPDRLISTSLSEKAAVAALAPNEQIAAIANTDKTLNLIDSLGQPLASSIKLPAVSDKILWAPNSGWLLLRYGASAYAALDTSRLQAPTPLPVLSGAKQVAWEARALGRILFIDRHNNLKVLNLSSGNVDSIAVNASSFLSTPEAIYVLDTSSQLSSFTLRGEPISVLPKVPEGTIKEIIPGAPGSFIYLMKDGSLWLLDKGGELTQVADQAQGAAWSPNKEFIYIQTDPHTLYVYNVSDERSFLPLRQIEPVMRLAGRITRPTWFNDTHIAYITENEIWLTEIDTRDHALSYKIDSIGLPQTDIYSSSQGRAIYYFKKIKGNNNFVLTSLTVAEVKK